MILTGGSAVGTVTSAFKSKATVPSNNANESRVTWLSTGHAVTVSTVGSQWQWDATQSSAVAQSDSAGTTGFTYLTRTSEKGVLVLAMNIFGADSALLSTVSFQDPHYQLCSALALCDGYACCETTSKTYKYYLDVNSVSIGGGPASQTKTSDSPSPFDVRRWQWWQNALFFGCAAVIVSGLIYICFSARKTRIRIYYRPPRVSPLDDRSQIIAQDELQDRWNGHYANSNSSVRV